MDKKERLPSFWRPFSDLPSFFETASSWLPEKLAFSNEKGLSVSEDDNSILIEAAIPGLKSSDVDISLDKGVLWIKGEKSEVKEDKKRKYYRKASSSYSYYTYLPETADLDQEPEASYENGVVKIKFKKKKRSKAKKIKVKQ